MTRKWEYKQGQTKCLGHTFSCYLSILYWTSEKYIQTAPATVGTYQDMGLNDKIDQLLYIYLNEPK